MPDLITLIAVALIKAAWRDLTRPRPKPRKRKSSTLRKPKTSKGVK